MIIIGEKINGSIPVVAEAIKNRDAEFIKIEQKYKLKVVQHISTVVHQFQKLRKLKH